MIEVTTIEYRAFRERFFLSKHRRSTGWGVRKIFDCGLKQIDRPPYSPDMTFDDYYLLGNLKEYLRGCHFSDDEKMTTAVWAHFEDKLKEYCLGVLNCC